MPAPAASRPLVFAHRGVVGGARRPAGAVVWAGSPATPTASGPAAVENTMDAFVAAVAAGADGIELDVRRTADGAFAIVHDATVGRTPVRRLTLAELRARSGIAVPVLGEVLDWAAGRIALDVELKEDGYVAEVAALLTRYRDAGGELIVTSFADAVLAQLPLDVPSGLLVSLTARGAGRRADRAGADAVIVPYKLVSDAVFADADAHDLAVWVWDYLPGRDGLELTTDPRVRAIITDDVAGTLRHA